MLVISSTEIRELEHEVGVHQEVLRLEIAMGNSLVLL